MSLRDRLGNLFKGDNGDIEISRFMDEYYEILLESDVSLETVEFILREFDQRFLKIKKINRDLAIEGLRGILLSMLSSVLPTNNILDETKKPYVLLFIGINGTGKTTSIAKLAKYFLKNGKKCVIAAGDTFRAGAIDQIKYHGNELGVKVINQNMGSDPSAVAFDSIEHAKARNIDYVLIDTAGRMQTNRNLMDEMKKIKKVAKPDLTILTVDAMAGSDAIEQVGSFLKDIQFDGVVVSKLDTDARGGAIFNIAHRFSKPIYFLGIGQNHEDLIPYDPNYILSKIFG
jgi:fused signal recognition particle receptor